MQRWVVVCWALLALVGADVCPDGGRCQEGQSCCKDASGGYKCCPSDQGKYAPSGVLCSDGVSECPEDNTCCKTPDGKFGCCPLPQAVCCKDQLHCCPHGKTCDLERSMCISSSGKEETPMLTKLSAEPRADWKNQKVHDSRTEKAPEDIGADLAPPPQRDASGSAVSEAAAARVVPCDATVGCPDRSTCCKTKEGGWSCCPLPEAVCCPDLVHCCPTGMKCDLTTQTCDQGGRSVPWLRKVPALPMLRARDVQCDSTHACQDGSTCCKTKAGEWACCPLPQAVCCDDHEHCCPTGTICDPATLKCNSPWGSVPMRLKTPAFVSRSPAQTRVVPCDATVGCPDSSTCCKTKEGGWSCCPLPEAVCCLDLVHCCPTGTTCDLTTQTCDQGGRSVPWLRKVPALPMLRARDVQCDSTHACQDGSTCCKTKAGEWACCPLPQAVCCDDHEHCCPTGTICDPATLKCNSPWGSVPMRLKTPAFVSRSPAQTRVVPCDATVGCPDRSTCCKTKEGGWSCCPLPEAVCCPDLVHCCPTGTTCDLTTQTCDQGGRSVPWLRKVPALPMLRARDVQCDSTHACQDGSTCCKTKAGEWACCPLPQAVCCDDHEHCCPTSTICDPATLKCNSPWGSVPMRLKTPAFVTRSPAQSQAEGGEGKDRIQCDAHTSCPQDTTCCLMEPTKEWGCCPLPEAVCCASGKHCCPAHYTCNESKATCIKGAVVIPWYPKLPATSDDGDVRAVRAPLRQRDVECPDHSICKDGQTCCKLSQTQWGCCPFPDAVCCSDMQHCCPSGFTCNVAGQCTQSGAPRWDYRLFFDNKKRAAVV